MVLNARIEQRWSLAGGPRGRAEKLQTGSYCAAIWKIFWLRHRFLSYCVYFLLPSAYWIPGSSKPARRQPEALANSRVYKFSNQSKHKKGAGSQLQMLACNASVPQICVFHQREINSEGLLRTNRGLCLVVACLWRGLQCNESCGWSDLFVLCTTNLLQHYALMCRVMSVTW